MDAVARTPAGDRATLFQETAARIGLPSAVVVEKDFWVCFLVDKLFRLDSRPPLLFKGGTSLAKAFKLIDRFSEDVDLTLDRQELGFDRAAAERSRKERERQMSVLGAACARVVREGLAPRLAESIRQALGDGEWGIESSLVEDGQSVLRFVYPRALSPSDYGGLAYIAPSVLMEIGARSDQEPCSRQSIRSYAAEHFPEQFGRPSTEATVLAPERTFWEKATILHAENHRPPRKGGAPPRAWSRVSRHAYDLFMMDRRGLSALARLDLLEKVAHHKSFFFHSPWACYDEAARRELRLVPSGEFETALRRDYEAMKEMLFGDVPAIDEIFASLASIEARVRATASGR